MVLKKILGTNTLYFSKSRKKHAQWNLKSATLNLSLVYTHIYRNPIVKYWPLTKGAQFCLIISVIDVYLWLWVLLDTKQSVRWYSVNSPQTWENNESGNFSPAILKPLYIYKKYMVDIDQFHTQMAGVKWILHLKLLTIFMSCTHLKDAPMVLFFLEKQILTSPSHSYRETRKNYLNRIHFINVQLMWLTDMNTKKIKLPQKMQIKFTQLTLVCANQTACLSNFR